MHAESKWGLECDTAIAAVRRAAVLCEAVRADLVNDDTLAKQDRSPVTVADFGSQAIINHALGRARSDIPIVAEEDAAALRDPDNATLASAVVRHVQAASSDLSEATIINAIDRGNYSGGPDGPFWTLDPIDGTKGFIRGGQYAIALALISSGQIQIGVLGCPRLSEASLDEEPPNGGCLMVAVRGQGAWMMSLSPERDARQPVRVANRPLRETRVCESYESGHTRHGAAAIVASRLGVEAPAARLDSQCKYAVVARGEAGIYLRLPTRPGYQEKIWDHAAGVLITEEAGGRVTDVHGNTLDFTQGRTLASNRGVVATHGAIHEAVLEAVDIALREAS